MLEDGHPSLCDARAAFARAAFILREAPRRGGSPRDQLAVDVGALFARVAPRWLRAGLEMCLVLRRCERFAFPA